MSSAADPGWAAILDQVRANLRDLAISLASYQADLITAGFREEQALMLTMALQTSIVQDLARGSSTDG